MSSQDYDSSSTTVAKAEARGHLKWAALFLGELRDGLTMINMQSAFLIVSKNYTEKQAGVLFFVFGMSQFLFQAPAGYLYDYTESKVLWLSTAGVLTTMLTLFTAFFAADNGSNLALMIFVKFIQGAVTSFIPPGLNSITQGIVGASGMTEQVSMNEMMNHLGTAIIVLTASLVGVALYPNLGVLFVVSPIACTGFLLFINRISPNDIDHAAARGLLTSETKSSNEYVPPSEMGNSTIQKNIGTQPSYSFGWNSVATSAVTPAGNPKPESPLRVLRDPILLTFIAVVFLFHTSNGTILPLVMQTLAIDSGRTGILMSGMCIIIAQIFMVGSARICGQYSGIYGRRPLFLVGLFIVPVRCLLLTLLLTVRGDGDSAPYLDWIILSTQVFDGVGAGVFGTMYILVTSDISGGTGRFSMTLGLTTAAMSIGGTVSGYLGEALAQDLGYKQAFFILMIMSTVPALLYLMFLPETLPSLTRPQAESINMKVMGSIKEHDEEGASVDSKSNDKYTTLV